MASTNQDNKSNNIDIQKMVEFVKKNARYFVAGALFVVLLLILVKFTGNGTGNADDNNVAVTETVVTEEAYEENAVPAVNELIKQLLYCLCIRRSCHITDTGNTDHTE